MAFGEQSMANEPRNDDNNTPSPYQPTTSRLSWFSWIFLLAFVALVIAVIRVSEHPVTTFVKVLSALIPLILVLALLSHGLSDPAVSKDFLLYQTFLSAVPLLVVTIIAEGIAVLLAIFILFAEEISELKENKSIFDGKLTGEELMKQVRDTLPMWKLIVMIFIVAFFVAALCEESAKYYLALRWKKVPHIRTKGIIEVSTAAGLGLAFSEHFMALSGTSVLLSYVRALLAFPIHCGTAFFIGMQMAELRQEGEITARKILPLPIAVHGTFDVIGLLSALFVGAYPFLDIVTGVVQASIVVALMVFLFWRYKRLIANDTGSNEYTIIGDAV